MISISNQVTGTLLQFEALFRIEVNTKCQFKVSETKGCHFFLNLGILSTAHFGVGVGGHSRLGSTVI